MSLFTTKLNVQPGHHTVEYVDHVCTRVLEPGRHAMRRRAHYRPVSVRERLDLIAPQEVLTSDGVTVRVTASVRSQVTDPRRFLEAADDPFGLVYLAVQVALREALVEVDAESVVRAARRALGDSVTLAARAVGARVGLDVLEVVVKDVILPPELRSAYSELVTAKTAARRSSRPRAPRPRRCGRWPTAPSCSTSTRPWRGCAWCRRCRTARSWSCRSTARPTRRRTSTVAGHGRHYGGGHALRLLRSGVRPDRHAVAVPALPRKGQLL